MNLLIPYINLLDHPDPSFKEFTYGDAGKRGKKLKSSLNKGDFVFFHTSINNKKFITAYYIIDRVIKTSEAIKDKKITAKFQNPHILRALENQNNIPEDDYILFGDPILSKILDRPLPFDKKLSLKLSLNIKFLPNKSETQSIGSSTRSWRELLGRDVDIIIKEIKLEEEKSIKAETILSTEEIVELLEKDIEAYLEKDPKLFIKSVSSIRRQVDTPVGRIDLIFEDNKSLLIAEIKLRKIGNEAIKQIRRYINWARRKTNKNVKGVVVCSGVMPAFQEDLSKIKDIKIFCYGWQLKVYQWH